jgi:predicted DCC family thiol-disulfide oxidoreductase YuxK
MKTLIYDKECPLCAAYTSAFVKTGLLEEEGRKSFDEIDAAAFDSIDKDKCNEEIPLVDTQSGKTWYGIDALLEILGSKMPWIKSIGTVKPVNWFLKKIYKLISFNRKIIVAVESKARYDCSPAFNTKYRVIFLALGLLLNSALWQLYFRIFETSGSTAPSYQLWIIAHYGVVAVNIILALQLGKRKGLEYLGQINMLALISMLLLLPVYVYDSMFSDLQLRAGWFIFGAISMLMAREYIRRMRYAGIFKGHRWVIAFNLLCLILGIYLIT